MVALVALLLGVVGGAHEGADEIEAEGGCFSSRLVFDLFWQVGFEAGWDFDDVVLPTVAAP